MLQVTLTLQSYESPISGLNPHLLGANYILALLTGFQVFCRAYVDLPTNTNE